MSGHSQQGTKKSNFYVINDVIGRTRGEGGFGRGKKQYKSEAATRMGSFKASK